MKTLSVKNFKILVDKFFPYIVYLSKQCRTLEGHLT